MKQLKEICLIFYDMQGNIPCLVVCNLNDKADEHVWSIYTPKETKSVTMNIFEKKNLLFLNHL